MTFTLTFAWWWIPTIITVVSLLIALCWPGDGGYLSGIETLFYLIPALFVSMVAWIFAAALK